MLHLFLLVWLGRTDSPPRGFPDRASWNLDGCLSEMLKPFKLPAPLDVQFLFKRMSMLRSRLSAASDRSFAASADECSLSMRIAFSSHAKLEVPESALDLDIAIRSEVGSFSSPNFKRSTFC